MASPSAPGVHRSFLRCSLLNKVRDIILASRLQLKGSFLAHRFCRRFMSGLRDEADPTAEISNERFTDKSHKALHSCTHFIGITC